MTFDPYAPKRARVAAKTKKWNTGTVTLTRVTRAEPEEETPWIPGTATPTTYTLRARVDGTAADYADNITVLETDLLLIVSPKALDADGAEVDLVPRKSDTLTIDGADKVIKKIDAVPAAGPAAKFHVFVAS